MNQNCFNNIGDIIADANYITEKALLPLSAIRTESDKTRYEKKVISLVIPTMSGPKIIRKSPGTMCIMFVA